MGVSQGRAPVSSVVWRPVYLDLLRDVGDVFRLACFQDCGSGCSVSESTVLSRRRGVLMIFEFDEALRYVDSGLVICPPWQIPTVSFGVKSILGKYGEQYVTIEKTHAFQLGCPHIITEHTDIGGCCWECAQIAESQGMPYPEWLSLQCIECLGPSHRCLVCSRGCCPDHRVALGDRYAREWYCIEHFEEREKEAAVAEVSARRGAVAARLTRFLDSLLFVDRKVLR